MYTSFIYINNTEYYRPVHDTSPCHQELTSFPLRSHDCSCVSDLQLIVYFNTGEGHMIWYFLFPKMASAKGPDV